MTTEKMTFCSATTRETTIKAALTSLTKQIETQFTHLSVDLIFVFLSPHFKRDVNELVETLQKRFQPQVLLGCTAEGVIGRTEEIEHNFAISLIAAHLPEVELSPFKFHLIDWSQTLLQAEHFQELLKAPSNTRLFMMIVDPFSTPMDALLDSFNTFYGNTPIVGGLASGSRRARGNALIFNQQIINYGAVGVALSGSFEADIIVSQGCRPIGQPMTVTSVKDNLIMGLDNIPPLTCLQELIPQLSPKDQQLLQNGLFIGRAINPAQKNLGRGDFLVRAVMGVEQRNGALMVSDYIQEQEVVQFHLRDAETAKEDLELMLTPQMFFEPPFGGILFSCNGRGTRLYSHPHGDISTIQKIVGGIDIAGFFCAGEIGPIGGRNFLHGHTASLALFRPLVKEQDRS